MNQIIKNKNLKSYYFFVFLFLSFLAEYKLFTSSFLSYLLAIYYIIFNITKVSFNKKQLFFISFFLYNYNISYSNDLIIFLKKILNFGLVLL